MTLRIGTLCAAALAAFSMQGFSSSAHAQQDTRREALPFVIEEIVVTARKREESLRQVPVAVTAMTAETILEANVSDVQDLALMSPGLSYREAFGRATGDANNRPSIRGMSSILGNPNAAFFVDGVYVDGPITSYSLENVERVEVIRGPQAATFGRGTFAGAVNFITRRPGDEFDGRIKLDGGDHDYSEISAYVSGPIVRDVLSAELNARHYDRGADPEYDNLAPNGGEIGAEETKAVGLKVNWTPTDDINLYLNLNWAEDTDGTFAYNNWNGGDNGDLDSLSSNSANTSNCFGPDFAFFSPFFTTNRSRGYWCGEIRTPGSFYQDLGGLDGVNRETVNANLIADFGIGDYTLTSVTGLTHYDYQNAFAAIYPGGLVQWTISDDNETFSQELRLTSPQDRPVRFVVGAYLYDQERGDIYNNNFDPLTTSASDVSLNRTSDDSTVENRALFGGVDWDVSDDLTLSAELRYQEEEVKLSGRDEAGNERFEGAPSVDFTATLPRVSFVYEAAENYNIYGSIAEGNSPGAFNDDFYDTRFVKAERDLFVGSRGFYDESEVTAYELGLKGSYFDGRMLLNVALYRNDWDKQPLTQSDALTQVATGTQTTVPYVINAGESRVQGVELELLARPNEYWDLGLSYALADSEFKDYLDENWRDLQDTNGIFTGLDFMGNMIVDMDDPDGQVAGNELPQTPRHMANLNATFHYPMENEAEAFFRFDINYESRRWVQAANLAYIGASTKANVRLGWRNRNWEFSLWGKNIGGDDTPEVVTRLLDFRRFFLIPSQIRVSGLRFTFIRDFTVSAPRSREIGATLTYRFGNGR